MKISLCIATFNRPRALAAALRSAGRQTRRPDEIIIGDDGSGPETAEVIRAAGESMGIPMRHAWHEHDDFRAGSSTNGAVALSTGDYLVFIDEDMLLHPEFLRDHEAAAEPGYFVNGGRVLLEEGPTKLAEERDAYWPGLFTPGVRNRKNLLRCGWLARLLGGADPGLHGIHSCNWGVWRTDFVRVNGFNEDFKGWGREDSELVARLMNSGVRRRNLRFAAPACHMWHPSRANANPNIAVNDAILAATVQNKLVRCERGLNLHLDGE